EQSAIPRPHVCGSRTILITTTMAEYIATHRRRCPAELSGNAAYGGTRSDATGELLPVSEAQSPRGAPTRPRRNASGRTNGIIDRAQPATQHRSDRCQGLATSPSGP